MSVQELSDGRIEVELPNDPETCKNNLKSYLDFYWEKEKPRQALMIIGVIARDMALRLDRIQDEHTGENSSQDSQG